MLTVRHARLEPSPTSRQDLRAPFAPVYGLVLWAIALLCIASLGQALVSRGDPAVDIATFAVGSI